MKFWDDIMGEIIARCSIVLVDLATVGDFPRANAGKYSSTMEQDKDYWTMVDICWFPKMGVPLDHLNFDGIFHEINHPCGITPLAMETSI